MTSTKPAREAGPVQGVILLLLALFPIMGLTTLTPVLPRMLEHFKTTPNADLWVPTAATLPYLAIALFSPIAGALSDRYGRRPLLLVAAGLYALSGTAPLFVDGLPAIMASRFAVGVSEAVIQSLSLALIGDYFKGQKRIMWLTLQPPVVTLASFPLGVASGLLAELSWRAPFGLYAVTILMFVAILLFIWEPEREPPSPHASDDRVSSRFPWTITLGIAAISFASAVIMISGPVQFGFVLKLAGVDSPAIVGYCISASSLIGVPIGSYLYSRIARLPVAAHLAISFSCGAIGLMGLAHLSNLYLLTAALTVLQAGFGLLMPTLANWAIRPLSHDQRGRGMGVWSMALFGGEFAGPVVVAPLNHLTGGLPATLAVFSALLGAGAALSAAFLHRRLRRVAAVT